MKVSCRMFAKINAGHSASAESKPLLHKPLIHTLVLFGLLSTLTSTMFAQATPLNLANNFFVTGDYIVAGAYNMTTSFQTIGGVSYAVGTIRVPDANSKGVANPGIQGPTQVPKGAQVVVALLYWQAVEKVGAPGSGQNGFFRPVFTGGPAAPGYPISGTNISGSNTVSWSSGGCSGGSTGKMLRTYRADVAGGMSVDASGNTVANGTFEVRLPSVGNSTPLTLGATLVVIYRLPAGAGGPSAPLKSIVIYDGDYSQSNAQLTMAQPMKGFYDADQSTLTRLTHIVGSGQNNKFQSVYLYNGATPPNPLNPLPSLYGKLPQFPGYYGTWDNPTWTLNSSPINADSSSATTKVVPSMSNAGCVSWGAVIMSTTVKNSDADGILDSWKAAQGYCDYLTNASCTGSQDLGWIPLLGATPGHKDTFLQYDYMCTKVNSPPQDDGLNGADNSCKVGDNINYSFDPRLAVDPIDNKNAVQKVVEAFNDHNVNFGGKPLVLHAVPGNAILETSTYGPYPSIVPATCSDTDLTCPFPNQPGTVGFREGLAYIKNQTIEPSTGLLGCDPVSDPNPCVAVFHHGKKDSYHYALFSHGVGLPNWFLSDGSLLTAKQTTATTVTFTTKSAHGISRILQNPTGATASDSQCQFGRVTVIFAISNPNLNGTFCAKNVTSTTFQITANGTAGANYTSITDPNLAVADGNVTSMSGYSDVGGQNSVISLGYGGWGLPQNVNPPSEGNKWNIKAGTFMHELGHTLGLTHGGTFYNGYNPQATPPNNDYRPTFETNCKPNVQTLMSYVFQFDLLQAPGPANQAPVKVLDFSEDPHSSTLVNNLTENSPQPAGYLSNLTYPYTSWFQLTSYSGASPATSHCDGTPVPANGPSYSYTNDLVSNFFWSASNPVTGNDINFNGNASDPDMHPHNEWEGTPAGNGAGLSPGVDLQQVSVAGTITTIGPGGEAGGFKPAGGGGGFKPAGGGGGLHPAGGGGGFKPAGGGGGFKPAGGGGLGAEINHGQANSYARPPQNLFIAEQEASRRNIDLSWFSPSFGQVANYKIYRSVAGGSFSPLNTVPGTQTTYQDMVSCNPGGYRYRVTAVVNNDLGQPLESTPSNIAPPGPPLLTGCYVTTNFSSPASGVQGSIIPVSWTLTDDFYATPPADWSTATSGHAVTNTTANTLVANGPFPGNCTTSGPTTILSSGVPTAVSGASTFSTNNGQFTFNWDSDAFCAGSYTFKLSLDSTQLQTTTTPTVLAIDIGDTDSTPHITTLSVPDTTVDLLYNAPLSEHGGVGAVSWSITSGSPPPNITLTPGGVLTGKSVVPPSTPINFTSQNYNFTVQVTDSATPTANTGTEAFNLRLISPISLSRTDYPIGSNPQGVITADFNGDGKADLAIANSGDDTVSILLGNGDGTFTALSPLPAGGSMPWSLAAGDFDGNGTIDLAVTNFNNANPSTVSVFLGNGDGTFGSAVTYPVGIVPISVATGDFNGDGITDLAVGNQNGATVSILIGDGLGAFSQPNPAYAVGATDLANVATGDFNGDGKLDLALTSPSDDNVSVALGNGDGTFGTSVPYTTGNSGDHPIPVSAVDLNGDGKLDLVVGNENASTVAILIGNGDGTFQPKVTYPANNGVFRGPVSMVAGDFDGDGKVDLAIANQLQNSVSILLGNGDGTVQNPLGFPTAGLSAADFTAGLAAGDFNGDGRPDFATANFTLGSVSVLLHLPQPPTNLAATNVTATQVPLTWTASTTGPVVNYNVYRASNSGGPYTLQQSALGNVTSYTDTVTSGHTYYYVVTTVTAVSPESVKSNEVSVTTP
jgi:FG-GAP-like repeat